MRNVFVVLAILVAVTLADDHYTAQYDGVDVDEILNNGRLFKAYVDCLMDRGPCSPDGTKLKEIIPEALEQDCAKCTDKQREGVKKVLTFTYKNKKDVFEEVENKYDPQKKFRSKHGKEAEEEGIKW